MIVKRQKGQFFIISAIAVVFAMILLGSSYFYSTLPLLREQAGWSDVDAMIKGVETELDYIAQADVTEVEIGEYLDRIKTYFASRGFGIIITDATNPFDPNCIDYNVTVTLPSCELFTFYTFTKCFEEDEEDYCHDANPSPLGTDCQGGCGPRAAPGTVCMELDGLDECGCRLPCEEAWGVVPCPLAYCAGGLDCESNVGEQKCECVDDGGDPAPQCGDDYPQCTTGDTYCELVLEYPPNSCIPGPEYCICSAGGGGGDQCVDILDPVECQNGIGCVGVENCVWNTALHRCGCTPAPIICRDLNQVNCQTSTGCGALGTEPCVWDDQAMPIGACGCPSCEGATQLECPNAWGCSGGNDVCWWDGFNGECICQGIIPG